MNSNPVAACLTDLGRATIVGDPSLGSSEFEMSRGTAHFMAPEYLLINNWPPSKEADIYSMALTIYQVHTARCLTRTHLSILPV
jgi:serine/threonine protein kinase